MGASIEEHNFMINIQNALRPPLYTLIVTALTSTTSIQQSCEISHMNQTTHKILSHAFKFGINASALSNRITNENHNIERAVVGRHCCRTKLVHRPIEGPTLSRIMMAELIARTDLISIEDDGQWLRRRRVWQPLHKQTDSWTGVAG